jgi:hypothetical protein
MQRSLPLLMVACFALVSCKDVSLGADGLNASGVGAGGSGNTGGATGTGGTSGTGACPAGQTLCNICGSYSCAELCPFVECVFGPDAGSAAGAGGSGGTTGAGGSTRTGGATGTGGPTGMGGISSFGGVTGFGGGTGVTSYSGPTSAVAYSPDGQLLAVGAEGTMPNVHLWRLSDGALVRDIGGIGGVTYSVAFSPDGKILATAGAQAGGGNSDPTPNIVKLWDVASGTLLQTIPASCGFYADSVSFSHDGTLLVTAGYVGPVEIWRVSDGTRVAAIPYPTTVHNAHFSPDDSRLIVGGIDGRVTVWTLPDTTLVLTLTGTAVEMADGDFSPDSRLIATTSPDNAIKIWDAATGVLLQSLTGHSAYVSHVVWIDNARLLSDDWSGQVFLWAATAGSFSESQAWSTGTGAFGLAVSPDKTQIAVAGGNAIVFFSLPAPPATGGTTGTGGFAGTGGATGAGGATASLPPDAGVDGHVEAGSAVNSCENPLPLQCGDRLNHSTLVQGRPNVWNGYGCSQRWMSGPEAIYFIQPPTGCQPVVQLKNLTADLSLFFLPSCDSLFCTEPSATVTGQPYFVVVDGYNGAAGSYTLEVDCTCNQDAGTSDASAPADSCSPATGSSDLPGVRLEITSGPCALTQAQAAAGASFGYRLVVDADVPGIVALNDLASCLQPDSSGLILAAEISGNGQSFCPTYDLGRCPQNSATTTAKAGSFDYELVWDGRNWQGPSDTNQPEGASFPAGSYTLSVTATGTRLVDAGVLPFTVAVSRPLVIDGAH